MVGAFPCLEARIQDPVKISGRCDPELMAHAVVCPCPVRSQDNVRPSGSVKVHS